MVTRIYLGICLSVALAALLSLSFYSLSRSERLSSYQTDALSGLMTLISDASQRQDESSRFRYLEIAAQLLGAELGRVPTGNAALPEDTLLALRQGEPVLLENQEDRIEWLLPFTQTELARLRLAALSEQQFRAHALLFVSELNRAAQTPSLADLQRYSSYGLRLASAGETRLDEQQRSRLARNSVVVSYNQADSNQFSVYAPLGQERVLVLGPVPQFVELPLTIVAAMVSLSLLIVVAIAYWLVRKLDRRLSHLASALQSFTDGNLRARVDMPSGDQIYELGLQINAMAAQIENLLRSQQDVMQAVSHDLRTPLSRIRFRLEAIQNNPGPNAQQKIDGIREDINELEALIDQVLEHQRLVRAPELQRQTFDLVVTVNKVGERLKDGYSEKRISARHPSSFLINAHEPSIDRLLQNLVSNACKHASEKVRVSVVPEADSVRLIVEDDGPGIPEAERDKVFDAFYRVDDSRNKNTGGYGLGLAICRRILELHDASASVTSSEWGGARFDCLFTGESLEVE